ncbi:hypothetical protein Scep_014742 [Stephania cephalantha]|uniref:Uncharacterized protein n=1 Tax=Stephania cephalantha TaxID=152367 RepID=A0AAP0J4E8_9MAGN
MLRRWYQSSYRLVSMANPESSSQMAAQEGSSQSQIPLHQLTVARNGFSSFVNPFIAPFGNSLNQIVSSKLDGKNFVTTLVATNWPRPTLNVRGPPVNSCQVEDSSSQHQ